MFALPEVAGYARTLRCYSPSFLAIEKPEQAHALEMSDKVILYQGLASQIHDVFDLLQGHPLIFQVENSLLSTRTHVGVLEFSGQQHGVCYLPSWVMHNLMLEEGAVCKFSVRPLPKITSLRLQAVDSSFLEAVADPKEALEEALRSFTCVTEGTELVVHHNDSAFGFHVKEVKPKNPWKAACLIGADCELELEPPEGMAEGAGAGAAAGQVGGGLFSDGSTGLFGAAAGGGGGGFAAGGAGGEAGAALSSSALGASGAGGNKHRPLEIGSTLEGSLAAGASAYFTLQFRDPSRMAVISCSSKPLSPPTAAAQQQSLAGSTLAGSAAGGAGAPASAGSPAPAKSSAAGGAGSPLLTASSPLVSRSAAALSNATAAELVRAAAGASASAAVAAVNRISASNAAAAAAADLQSLIQKAGLQGQAEADLYISPTVSKPSHRQYSWGDFSVSDSKQISLVPEDPDLPQPNAMGAVVLYCAVTAFAGPLQYSISLSAEDVPTPAVAGGEAVGSKAGSIRRAGAGAVSQGKTAAGLQLTSAATAATVSSSSSSSSAAAPAAAAAPPGKKLCSNCGSTVAEASFLMHESFCRRNNVKCRLCSSVMRVSEQQSHIHCSWSPDADLQALLQRPVVLPGSGTAGGAGAGGGAGSGAGAAAVAEGAPLACTAVLRSEAEQKKHLILAHSPLPCDLCAALVLPEAYEAHVSRECSSRRVECSFCGLTLKWRDRASHETACGARTAPCAACGKLVPRKRMERHMALEHGIGDPDRIAAYTGATPETPFLGSEAAAAAAAAGMPDFDLAAEMGLGAAAAGGRAAVAGGGAGATRGSSGQGAVAGQGSSASTPAASSSSSPSKARSSLAMEDVYSFHYYDEDDNEYDDDLEEEEEEGSEEEEEKEEEEEEGHVEVEEEEERAEESTNGGSSSKDSDKGMAVEGEERSRSAGTRPKPSGPSSSISSSSSSQVQCPSCGKACKNLELLQDHCLTDCPKLGSEEHAEVVASLLAAAEEGGLAQALASPAAASKGSSKPASSPSSASAPAPASSSAREASVPAAAGGAGGSVGAGVAGARAGEGGAFPTRPFSSSWMEAVSSPEAEALVGPSSRWGRARRTWSCPQCDESSFAAEDEVQLHILTECGNPKGLERDVALTMIKPTTSAAAAAGGGIGAGAGGAGISSFTFASPSASSALGMLGASSSSSPAVVSSLAAAAPAVVMDTKRRRKLEKRKAALASALAAGGSSGMSVEGELREGEGEEEGEESSSDMEEDEESDTAPAIAHSAATPAAAAAAAPAAPVSASYAAAAARPAVAPAAAPAVAPTAAAPAGGAGSAEGAFAAAFPDRKCPSCGKQGASFDQLYAHMISECPEADMNAAIISSLE